MNTCLYAFFKKKHLSKIVHQTFLYKSSKSFSQRCVAYYLKDSKKVEIISISRVQEAFSKVGIKFESSDLPTCHQFLKDIIIIYVHCK